MRRSERGLEMPERQKIQGYSVCEFRYDHDQTHLHSHAKGKKRNKTVVPLRGRTDSSPVSSQCVELRA